MSNRKQRASVAQETLLILEEGKYLNQANEEVNIRESLDDAIGGTELYAPNSFKKEVFPERDEILGKMDFDTQYEVTEETTLQAAKRLVTEEGFENVAVLNFASAKNPGGGFQGGSQAQEESLARASGLVKSLESKFEMYETNRKAKTGLYLDYMIYSPDIPVFRNDDDQLLDAPYPVSFITAPAVNAGSVKSNYPQEEELIEPTMIARVEKVLSLATAYQHEVLVLGAWGCGVFKNNPQDIANYFASHLFGDGLFCRAYRKIVFAVYSGKKNNPNLPPFQHHFGQK